MSNRENNQAKGNKMILLIVVQIILFAVLFLGIRYVVLKGASGKMSSGANEEDSRRFANKLLTEDLVEEAAEAYEDYLRDYSVSKNIQANIYYSLGTGFMKNDYYERALSYFYKAEIADPDATFKAELNRNVVLCLEKLGRSLDAYAEGAERVQLESVPDENTSRGVPIMRIGNQIYKMGDVYDHMEALPDVLRDLYKDEAKKDQYVQRYIENRILLKKAMALKYQDDPQIRKQLRLAQEGLIIDKLIHEEIADKIRPDEHDLLTFYEAHLNAYKENEGDASAKPFEEVYEEVQTDYLREKANVKYRDYIANLLMSYDVEIFYKAKNPEKGTREDHGGTETEEEEKKEEDTKEETRDKEDPKEEKP